ncbi:hypothetical protein b3_0064 [Synechococcus phage B3]|nr:hypothetical protein b3_0064 [Synechococcus phage B3]QGT54682.1 hypothetical protein b23_0064 [Synechococcus phage B23]
MKGAAHTKLYSYHPICEPISGLPWHLAFGKMRREAIKKEFLNNPRLQQWGLRIDSSWCPQLKNDPELRQLVKSGFLKQVRRLDKSYLVLNDSFVDM